MIHGLIWFQGVSSIYFACFLTWVFSKSYWGHDTKQCYIAYSSIDFYYIKELSGSSLENRVILKFLFIFSGGCPHRQPPSNGAYTRLQRTKTTWFVNEEAIYVCDDGFVLSGNRASRCLSTGLWSESVPTCGRRK